MPRDLYKKDLVYLNAERLGPRNYLEIDTNKNELCGYHGEYTFHILNEIDGIRKNVESEKVFDRTDKSILTRIDKRLIRLTEDNYGEFKQLDSNISELKINFGSGYRIYYTEKNDVIIILLCAGDKKTQSKDIQKAKEYFEDWKGRENG